MQAVLAANPIVIEAYWNIGKVIVQRQHTAAWGAKVIDRLAVDLQRAFPQMRGLTRRNLLFMKSFAEAFPSGSIVKQPVSQLPWGHIIRLLQMIKEPEDREFYIRQSIANGWSRRMMQQQIEGTLHLRSGTSSNNFKQTMPLPESTIADQLFKDPYLFDFLGTADIRREAEVQQALIDHIQRFLLELGTGFAFVGQQIPLAIEGASYRLDLLFYHLKLRRFVVIELKSRAFIPGDVGQLNMYLSAVDDLLRHEHDQPSIGLLLCRKKNKLVAEYALRGLDQSMAVAEWHTTLSDALPAELQRSLPTIEEIETELSIV